MTKRILHEFRLGKIAAVDKPCQEHATSTIMKRKLDLEPTTVEEDATMADKDLEGQVADLTTKLEKATTDLAHASLLAKMSDAEKTFAKDMTVDEATAFMALDETARMAKIKPADDETLIVDGSEVRKSAVGAGMFAILKSQNDRLNQQQLDIAKSRDQAEMATLTKRAGDEFSHVAGTDDEKAGILKAMVQMPEAVRKSLEAILKSAEAMAKKGFKADGHSMFSPEAGSAAEELDTLAKAHAKEHKVDYVVAYNEVITKRADLYDRVLKEGN